jgi:hypothetical protein
MFVGNGEFPRELPVNPAAEFAAAVVPPSKTSALSPLERMGLDPWTEFATALGSLA